MSYLLKDWEVVIGMEVHAQIITKTKLFSSAPSSFGEEPNENVAFIDAGFPGMLPSLNEHAIDQAIRTGLGISGHINLNSYFDRKNYFYPDLPQGYQISQFFIPLVSDGYIDIESKNVQKKRIRIERIHVEQDAGKNIHDKDPYYSLVDLNRAGVPLMEIVTKPDISSPEEACLFLSKLRTMLRYLKTCNGNMEEGSMRADINVSVRRKGEPLGTRVEIKNVNSLKFIAEAINYEVERQIDLINDGGKVVQETRLFNSITCETKSLRTKEDAQDYRYFTDPDIPMLKITEDRVNKIKDSMPELPDQKKNRYMNDYGLTEYDASVLISEPEIAGYFESAISEYTVLVNNCEIQQSEIKLITNWISSELFAKLNSEQLAIEQSKISPKALSELVMLINTDVISGKIAKDVFQIMWDTGDSAVKIVDEKGMRQITDTNAIEESIRKVLSENPDKLQEYKSGKVKLFGFFVGLLMKETKGKANPQVLNKLLKEYMDK